MFNAMKFTILIFGCQMNYSDSARIKAVLTNCGFSYVPTVEEADIVIFDTCSVRQKSEDKVFGKLLEIPKSKKVRVTGCMIQHNFRNEKVQNEMNDKKVAELMKHGNFIGSVQTLEPEIIGFTNDEMELKMQNTKLKIENSIFVNHAYNPMFVRMQTNFPHVELFFRIDDTWFLPLMLKRLGYSIKADPELTNEYSSIIPEGSNQLFKENTKTAYVPISTGCSQFCAYCIVPYARGLEKNRPVEEIIKEIQHHLDQGIEEIVLIGQIVNKHPQFVEILQKTLELKPTTDANGLKRLRYTSPYPNFFSKELLALHEAQDRLCPHIHMPLQSGSDPILKKMFRGYTIEQFKQFVDNIRALKRPISITTDIIIGFPDETEEDFQGSLDMIHHAKFDMIYMGIYSPRPGTLGARKYEDNITKEEKHARRERMNELLLKTSLANNQLDLGKTQEILINKIGKDFATGYNEQMKTVVIKDSSWNSTLEGGRRELKIWEFARVRIIGAESMKVFGEVI